MLESARINSQEGKTADRSRTSFCLTQPSSRLIVAGALVIMFCGLLTSKAVLFARCGPDGRDTLQLAPQPARAGAPLNHVSTSRAHYTSTGLDSRKIAIWAFIGSECMLFVSLISTYLIYKGGASSVRSRTRHGSVLAGATPLQGRFSTSRSRRRRRSCCSCRRCPWCLRSRRFRTRTSRSARRGERILGSSKLWLLDDGDRSDDVPRLPGVRVHVVRARRADDPDESLRIVVLHAHRLPRRARDGRRALAADAARDRLQARPQPARRAHRRHRARCTGTSSTSSGSRSSPSSTSSSRATTRLHDPASATDPATRRCRPEQRRPRHHPDESRTPRGSSTSGSR